MNYMNRSYLRTEVPPPISEWRRNILRICAEDRQIEKYQRRLCTQKAPAPVRKPAAKREPRVCAPRVRKRKLKMRTLCQCGRTIRAKDRLWCVTCFDRPKQIGISPRCTECGKQLNFVNKSGLCRVHGNHPENRALAPRPTCKHEADGMRCVQVLYRTNRTGLCRWHSPDPIPGTPKMEPIQ